MADQDEARFSMIRYEVDSDRGVATLTLCNARRGNAITAEMGDEVVDAVGLAAKDRSVRVVVLTGEGKYFCTGMDLGASNQKTMRRKARAGSGGGGGGGNASQSLSRMFEVLDELHKPLVVRLNGPAIGGGVGLVFLGDVRVMEESSYLWLSEVKRGLAPAMISTFIVPQIGAFAAKEMFLRGNRIAGPRARELGMVSEVATDGCLDEAVDDVLDDLLSSAPEAMGVIKSLVSYVDSHNHEEALAEARRVFMERLVSGEAAYGIDCFRKKMKPDWGAFLRQSRL